MYFLTTVAVLSLAVLAHAEDSQQYRLVRTEYKCGDQQRCPSDPEVTAKCREIVYGVKREDLKARFCVDYQPNGLVNITVEAIGTVNYPVASSLVIVGNAVPERKCLASQEPAVANSPRDTVQFDLINFGECGFGQTFDGNKVHRSIVIKLRHRFHTGAVDSLKKPVYFIGYRDITADFWLEPVSPPTEVISPPIPIVDEELDVCLNLDTELKVFTSAYDYFWHIKVSSLGDWVSQTFGLGFKLEQCWVYPRLASGQWSSNPVVFLSGGKLDTEVLFDKTVIPFLTVVQGKEYQFSFGQITDGALSNAQLHPSKEHKVHCSVCLCRLHECPATIDHESLRGDALVVQGRGGFATRSIRPLFEEAVLRPGYARQV